MSELFSMYTDILPTPLTSRCLLPSGYRDRLPEESDSAVAALIKGLVQAAHLGDDKGMTKYMENYFAMKTVGHRFTDSDRIILADICLRKAISISDTHSMPYVDVARYIRVAADVLRSEPSLDIKLDWRPLMRVFIRHVFLGTSILLTDNYENDQKFGVACDDAFMVLARYYDFGECDNIRQEIRRYRELATTQTCDALFRYVCLLVHFIPQTTALPLMREYLRAHPVDLSVDFDKLIAGKAFVSADDTIRGIITTTTQFLHATHAFYQEYIDELISILVKYHNDGVMLFALRAVVTALQLRPDIDFSSERYTQIFIYKLCNYSGSTFQIEATALSDLLFFSEPKDDCRDDLVIPEWVNSFSRYQSLSTALIAIAGDLLLNLIYTRLQHNNFVAMISSTQEYISHSKFVEDEIAPGKNVYYLLSLRYFKSLPQDLEKLGMPAKQFIFSVIHILALYYTMTKCYVRMIMPIYQGMLPFLYVPDTSLFEPHVYVLRDILFSKTNHEHARRTDYISIAGILFGMYPKIMLPRLVWLMDGTIHRPEEQQKTYKFVYYNMVLALPTLIGLCFNNGVDVDEDAGCADWLHQHQQHQQPGEATNHHSSRKVLAHFIDDAWSSLCSEDTLSTLKPTFIIKVLSTYSRFLSAINLQGCQFALLLFLQLFATIPMNAHILCKYPQFKDLISLYVNKVLELIAELDGTFKTRPPIKDSDPQNTDLSFKAIYLYGKSRQAINIHILRMTFASLLGNITTGSISELVLPKVLKFIRENELLMAKKEVQAAFSGITMGILSGTTDSSDAREVSLRNEVLNTLYTSIIGSYKSGLCTLKWTLILLQSFARFDHTLHLNKRGIELRSFLLFLMDEPNTRILLSKNSSSQTSHKSSNVKYSEFPHTIYTHFLKLMRAVVRAISFPYPTDWSIGQLCDKFYPLALCTPEDRRQRLLYHKIGLFPQVALKWSSPSVEGRRWATDLMLSFVAFFNKTVTQEASTQDKLWSYKFIFKVLPLFSDSFSKPCEDPDIGVVRNKTIFHVPSLQPMIAYLEQFDLPTTMPLFALRHEQLRKYRFLPPDPRIYMYLGVDTPEETREGALHKQMLDVTGVLEMLNHQEAQINDAERQFPFPLTHSFPEELSNVLLDILLEKEASRPPDSSCCSQQTHWQQPYSIQSYGDLIDIYGLQSKLKPSNTSSTDSTINCGASVVLKEPPIKRHYTPATQQPISYFVPETFHDGFLKYLATLFDKTLVEPRFVKLISHIIELAVTNKAGYNLIKTLIVTRELSDKLCPAAFHTPVADFYCTYERNLRGMGLHLARHSFGETDCYNNSPHILHLYLQMAEYILFFSVAYDDFVSKVAVYVLGKLMNMLDIEGDCFRFYSQLIEPCCRYLSLYEDTKREGKGHDSGDTGAGGGNSRSGTQNSQKQLGEIMFDAEDVSKMHNIIMEEVSERLEMLMADGVQITEELMNKVLEEVMASSGLKGNTVDMLAALNGASLDCAEDNSEKEKEELDEDTTQDIHCSTKAIDDERNTINPEENEYTECESGIEAAIALPSSHMTYLCAIRTMRYFLFLSQSLAFYMKRCNRFNHFVKLFSHIYTCKNELVHGDANEMAAYMTYWEPTHPGIPISLEAVGVLSRIGAKGEATSISNLIDVYKSRFPPTICPIVDTECTITKLPLSAEERDIINIRQEQETRQYIELMSDSLGRMSSNNNMHGDTWKAVHIAAKCHILTITYGLPTSIEFIDRLFDCTLVDNVMLMDPLLTDIVELTICYKPYDTCDYKEPDAMAGFYRHRNKMISIASSEYGLHLATFSDFRAYLQRPETQEKLISIITRVIELNQSDNSEDSDDAEMSLTDIDAIFLTIWTNLCAIAGDENSLAMFLLQKIDQYLRNMAKETELHKCNSHILAEVTGAAIKSFKYAKDSKHRADEVAAILISILSQVIQKADSKTGEPWQSILTLSFDMKNREILISLVDKYMSYLTKLFDENTNNATVQANALLLLGFFMDALHSIDPALEVQLSHTSLEFILSRGLCNSLKVLRESTTAVLGVSLNNLLKAANYKETKHNAILGQFCEQFHTAASAWSANPEVDEKKQTNVISTMVQGVTCVSVYGKNTALSRFIVDHFLDALIELQTHKDSLEVRHDTSALILLVANMDVSMDFIHDLLLDRLPMLLQKHSGRWRSALCIYELAARLLKMSLLCQTLQKTCDMASHQAEKESLVYSALSIYILKHGLAAQHDELISAIGEMFLTILIVMPFSFQWRVLSEVIDIGKQKGEPRKRLIVAECLATFLKHWNDHIPPHAVNALLFLARLGSSKHEMVAKIAKRFFLWFWSTHTEHFDQIKVVFADQQVAALKATHFNAEYII